MENSKKNNSLEIIRQFQENNYPKETEEKVQRWLLDDKDSGEKEKASLAYWNTLEVAPDKSAYHALKRVNSRIVPVKAKPVIPLHRYLWRIAAIIIPLAIVSGIYFYHFQNIKELYVSTAYGETRQVILPDSSEVWLNSGSNIRYPASFRKNNRSVNLDGEAYFVVKKDESRLFIVQTSQLSVKVVGTTFNVKAYASDSKTITTLNSGKVEIHTGNDQTYILNPDEQLIYHNLTTQIEVTEITAEEVSGWMSGQLCFINAPWDEILKTLERRFNVSFVTQQFVEPNENYTVKFVKNDSLDEILYVLKDMVGDFTWQKEDHIVTLKSTK